jgi:hypothetical protein
MAPHDRPRYVYRWKDSGSLQPFDAYNAKMLGFLFAGERDALQSLCERHLNRDPTRTVVFEPFTHYVLVTFTDIAWVTAAGPPFKDYGGNPELELTVWVLVRQQGTALPRLFTPYCLLNNPLAVQHGREVYGFPKEMARFPAWTEDDLQVEAYAFDVFAPTTIGKYRPVLAVTRERSTIGDALAREFTHPLALVGELVPHLLEGLPKSLWPPHGPIVFLKQLPDATDSTWASYQAIIEAEIAVTRIRSVVWRPGTFALTLNRCASHPFEDDLGIASGAEALVNFSVDFDFTLRSGTELWRAEAR